MKFYSPAIAKPWCHCDAALLRRKIVASKLRRCEKALPLGTFPDGEGRLNLVFYLSLQKLNKCEILKSFINEKSWLKSTISFIIIWLI